MLKILIVEDNEVVRTLMADLFAGQNEFEITGLAANGLEALSLLKSGTIADIVLADLNMPDMDGIELTRKIVLQHSDIKVIILTMHENAEYLKRALDAGAKGYLLKDGNMEDVYRAIKRVEAGQLAIGV